MHQANQHKKRNFFASKTAFAFLLIFSCAASFATLGDGKRKPSPSINPLLSNRNTAKPGYFSLNSNYNYRGNSLFNSTTEKRVINLKSVITSQKGNTTYIIPLKKKTLVVKLDIGNRQLRRN
jgi:hypothetical protein